MLHIEDQTYQVIQRRLHPSNSAEESTRDMDVNDQETKQMKRNNFWRRFYDDKGQTRLVGFNTVMRMVDVNNDVNNMNLYISHK